MTEKRGQIQGKWNLFELAGEFELSEFELPGVLLYNFIDLDCFSMQAGTKFWKKKIDQTLHSLV